MKIENATLLFSAKNVKFTNLNTNKVQNPINNKIPFRGNADNNQDIFEINTKDDTNVTAPSYSCANLIYGRNFIKRLEEHIETAFLYDPSLPYEEKLKIIKENETLTTGEDFIKGFDKICPDTLLGWIKQGCLVSEKYKDPNSLREIVCINTGLPQNKKFLERLKERIPHCVSGYSLAEMYNIPIVAIDDFIKTGKLKPFGAPADKTPAAALFDMEDKTNKALFEKHGNISDWSINPKLAFLYDPNLTDSKKRGMIRQSTSIFYASVVATTLGVKENVVLEWIKNNCISYGQVLNDDKTTLYCVDMTFPSNEKFFEDINQKIPNSISASALIQNYKIPKEALQADLESGKLKALGFDNANKNVDVENVLFDLEDENNRKAIYARLMPDEAKDAQIFSFNELKEYLNVPENVVAKWLELQVISSVKLQDKHLKKGLSLININSKDNKALLEDMAKKLPTCMSKQDFMDKYNYTQSQITSDMSAGKLKPVEFAGASTSHSAIGTFFNLEEEVNKRAIKQHTLLNPLPSKKYFNPGGETMVPVHYLQKLGYGNVKKLVSLVKAGKLPGKIIHVKTPEGEQPKLRVYVDIAAKNTENILKDLRTDNFELRSITELADELDMKRSDIIEAILNGELEIINEYIFFADRKDVLIDGQNPKNNEFIERTLLEKLIAREQSKPADKTQKPFVQTSQKAKIKNPFLSLRMKLVHYYSPKLREAASFEAKSDGFAVKVFGKMNEDGKESLSIKEMLKYKSFMKKVWLRTGKEERAEANRKASLAMEQYKKDGLDGVEDPNARKIIEEFLKANGGQT